MKVTKQALRDIEDGIDELSYEVCNSEFISGEAFYTIISCYAEAKLAELAGELASWGIMSIYKFRITSPQTGPYVDVYHNTESYWKTVSEAQEIVRAKAPSGATVEYIGS